LRPAVVTALHWAGDDAFVGEHCLVGAIVASRFISQETRHVFNSPLRNCAMAGAGLAAILWLRECHD